MRGSDPGREVLELRLRSVQRRKPQKPLIVVMGRLHMAQERFRGVFLIFLCQSVIGGEISGRTGEPTRDSLSGEFGSLFHGQPGGLF